MSWAPPERASLSARGRARILRQRRRRLVVLLVMVGVAVAALISALAAGPLPGPPRAGLAAAAAGGNPFGYAPARESEYIARATAGNAHALFVKSPGGAVATAARVAAYRPLIDRAVAGTGIDPALLEGIVFVESAGRAQVIAGNDPTSAAGLTQILAQTGQSLLGMHIDLARSRRLTTAIDGVASGTRRGRLAPLLARRAAIDDRFNPAKELAGTVRYLRFAQHQFGRVDLAAESYHMGVGNLHQVLSDYNGGHAVPYVQLYFDSAPDNHGTAYRLLAGFGDDSWLYYWRILGAVSVMRLYRSDRTALTRLASLQNADSAGAYVLHPPDRTPGFADPSALSAAYQDRTLVPLPTNLAALGLAVDPTMGSAAGRLGVPRGLYRGLRPAALKLIVALAARVRSLAGGAQPLQISSTVADHEYQRATGSVVPAAAAGWSFQIARHYVSAAQAQAFQAVLDRLQALNLIAWARAGSMIDVTVAANAAAWLR
ncbi:MAG: hypothetical protein ACRDNK_11745 [Solirubrobacteraceae bacterium]